MLRFDFCQDYVVFDFETLNLCISQGDIDLQAPWQLGYLVARGHKIVNLIEKYIYWPDFHEKALQYGQEALKITKFDKDDYDAKAEDPSHILRGFDNILLNESFISISANGVGYDQHIYNIYRTMIGLPYERSWHNRHYDIQCVEKAKELKISIPKIGTDSWGIFMIKMSTIVEKGIKTSLSALCKKYSLTYDPDKHHVEASYDCLKTYEIFLEQIKTTPVSK